MPVHEDDLARNVNSAYETYTLNAPDDPRLPSSVAGQPITFYSVTSAANVAAQRFLTWETTYGPERDSHWDGFDITLNARTRQGLTVQGGTTTGRAVADQCQTTTQFNNTAPPGGGAESPDPRGCRNVDPWQTTVRGLASYTRFQAPDPDTTPSFGPSRCGTR